MVPSTRTFRIFVSSTFLDLTAERNALHQYVFPALRELCRKNGTHFQAIDLRWGVRTEASLDQQTMKICLREVERSRQVSPRPNFIVLLGQRYGWCPLPYAVPEKELEKLRDQVSDESDRALLDEWYLKDNNAIPAEYCLQPRTPELSENQTEEERTAALVEEEAGWRGTEGELRRILTDAVDRSDLAAGERRKYQTSATEQEIDHGAFSIEDANEHVFCFFRTIEGLPEDESAAKFRDLDTNHRPDTVAEERLESLKSRLRSELPDNVYDYDVSWSGGDIATDRIGTLPESLEECLALRGEADLPDTLCVRVWLRLSAVILSEIHKLKQVDALEKEEEDHEAFREDRAKFFLGRTNVLKEIDDYLVGTDRQLLVVHGQPGSGKSAVMAYAIGEARREYASARILQRFIGATAGSSDIRTLLDTLCRQISRDYGADETTVPTDYRELVQDFPKRLALATAEQPLILFLDALDQLSDADNARNLIWLPAEIPEHVRLVVSTLPGECLSVLERKLPQGSRVEVENMSRPEGGELLKAWLDHSHRDLQESQKDEVLNKFTTNGTPLYLRLAFEEARRWKSYWPVEPLRPETKGIIRSMFVRLSRDANHGGILLSCSLAYLAAAKNGLSEDEMLDVLTLDTSVLEDFKKRARHEPPQERLPVIVWSRLYFDLEPYLTERTADGASLLDFYHRQLREVVEEDYLAGETKTHRHQTLAGYFQDSDLFEKEGEIANLRKLSEQPFQQTYGERWDDVYATLTDFEFLEAKCTYTAVTTQGEGEDTRTVYGGVYELQEDYRRALEHFPEEQ